MGRCACRNRGLGTKRALSHAGLEAAGTSIMVNLQVDGSAPFQGGSGNIENHMHFSLFRPKHLISACTSQHLVRPAPSRHALPSISSSPVDTRMRFGASRPSVPISAYEPPAFIPLRTLPHANHPLSPKPQQALNIVWSACVPTIPPRAQNGPGLATSKARPVRQACNQGGMQPDKRPLMADAPSRSGRPPKRVKPTR